METPKFLGSSKTAGGWTISWTSTSDGVPGDPVVTVRLFVGSAQYGTGWATSGSTEIPQGTFDAAKINGVVTLGISFTHQSGAPTQASGSAGAFAASGVTDLRATLLADRLRFEWNTSASGQRYRLIARLNGQQVSDSGEKKLDWKHYFEIQSPLVGHDYHFEVRAWYFGQEFLPMSSIDVHIPAPPAPPAPDPWRIVREPGGHADASGWVSATSWGQKRLDVFAGIWYGPSMRGLGHTHWPGHGGMRGWETISSDPAGPNFRAAGQTIPIFATCSWGAERLDIFAPGRRPGTALDGLNHAWYENGWKRWEYIKSGPPLGSTDLFPIGAVAPAANEIYVMCLHTEGISTRLACCSLDSGQWNWSPVPTTGLPEAAYAYKNIRPIGVAPLGSRSFELATVAGNNLYTLTFSNGQWDSAWTSIPLGPGLGPLRAGLITLARRSDVVAPGDWPFSAFTVGEDGVVWRIEQRDGRWGWNPTAILGADYPVHSLSVAAPELHRRDLFIGSSTVDPKGTAQIRHDYSLDGQIWGEFETL